MEPVFVDLHIHTSENPEKLNPEYNLTLLKSKIEKISGQSLYLISLTDHNTINKPVYLKALELFKNILLGVELHVRNYSDKKPYHCHMYFDVEEINGSLIDKINAILISLYPKKEVSATQKNIPKLEEIMTAFSAFEFIILPHGGQSHSAFHSSISKDEKFDNILERSIYYNHFDGFTARSNGGLEKTNMYFERLGISEFVNLVTSTDNYKPENYPNARAKEAPAFVPTWMLAEPTFNGIRLSLSESARLVYGEKPDSWAQYIKHVYLKNDKISIDARLTSGLNVVIGGSSSGKTLFVDSLFKKIDGNFEGSEYLDTPYNVSEIQVENPSGILPHYINQNYIMKICDKKDKENTIDNISILKSVFPGDSDEREEIANGLTMLNSYLATLVQSIKEIQSIQDKLSRIPHLSHLIVTDRIQGNPINSIYPTNHVIELIKLSKANYEKNVNQLNTLEEYLANNPLVNHNNKLIPELIIELNTAFSNSKLELAVRNIIDKYRNEIDISLEKENREIQSKRKDFVNLLRLIKQYISWNKKYNDSLINISKFTIKSKTQEIKSRGHILYIDNKFELTKTKFLEVINGFLKKEYQIRTFESILPESLFDNKFKKRAPNVSDYDDFENKVKNTFMEMNHKQYRIITKEGKDFEQLSAGWKTSVVLDLILGWESDIAPLIIDQPEDNLATSYINEGLIKAIKQCKIKKQIIVVSHNATIPMLGDAQNIILCVNDDNYIEIKSNPLEGKIDGRKVVDLVAKITDGGKRSIKKRIKKYNLKSFRGEK